MENKERRWCKGEGDIIMERRRKSVPYCRKRNCCRQVDERRKRGIEGPSMKDRRTGEINVIARTREKETSAQEKNKGKRDDEKKHDVF